jgi:enterochelin esterase-like enzyme
MRLMTTMTAKNLLLVCGGVLIVVALAATPGRLLAEMPPFQPVETSPVLTALEQKLHSGDSKAVETFWADAARRTTPIVETIPEDSQVYVTFLWRDTTGTVKSMALALTLMRMRGLDDVMMTHLAGTDVWYKAYKMRPDFRFTYRFLPNPTMIALAFPDAFKSDPLNPKKLTAKRDAENPGASVIEGSIAELPRAAAEPWLETRPGVPAGSVGMERFQSEILKDKRRIWTYLPPGYDPKARPYALLICFDGILYSSPKVSAGGIPAPTILDNLIAARRIPPLVALFIESPWNTRNVDQTNHRAFVDFLANEVLPWAHKKWNITADPQQTVVNGVSSGGLTSSYVAFQRPSLFGNVLSQSGAYWRGNEGDEEHFEWLTHQFETSPTLPIRFVLQVGLGELAPAPNGGPNMVQTNRHLRDVLKTKGYDVQYTDELGSHEPVTWRDGFAEGLISLFSAKYRSR